MNKQNCWYFGALVCAIAIVLVFGVFLPQAEEKERQANIARTRAIEQEVTRKQAEEEAATLKAEQDRLHAAAVAAEREREAVIAEEKKRRQQLNNERQEIETLIAEELKRLDVEPRDYNGSSNPFATSTYDWRKEIRDEEFDPTGWSAKVKVFLEKMKGKTGTDAAETADRLRDSFRHSPMYMILGSIEKQLQWRAMLDKQRPVWEAAAEEVKKHAPDLEFGTDEGYVVTSERFIATLHDDDKRVTVWDYDGNIIFTDTGPMLYDVAQFSPDGSKLAVGFLSGVTRVYETSDWSYREFKNTSGHHKMSDGIGGFWEGDQPIGELDWHGERYLVACGNTDAVSVWDLEAKPPKEIFAKENMLHCCPKLLEMEVKGGEVAWIVVESQSFGTRRRWDKDKGFTTPPPPSERLGYGIDDINRTRTRALWYGLGVDQDGVKFIQSIVARYRPGDEFPREQDIIATFRKESSLRFSSDGNFLVGSGEKDGFATVYTLDGKEVFRRRFERGRGLKYGDEAGRGCGGAVLQWTKDGYVLVARADIFGGPVKLWKRVLLPINADM